MREKYSICTMTTENMLSSRQIKPLGYEPC